jgi:hypothetical protein
MKNRILNLLWMLILPATALAETPWENYLNFPTGENASRVPDIAYSKATSSFGKLEGEILALQVYAGDREALRLAIRLTEKSDGGNLEDLIAIIGHVIRPYPRLFLEEIKFSNVSIAKLEDIVLNTGLEYSDRPKAHQYELEMRLEAIYRVNKAELRSLRKASIDALNRELISTLPTHG